MYCYLLSQCSCFWLVLIVAIYFDLFPITVAWDSCRSNGYVALQTCVITAVSTSSPSVRMAGKVDYENRWINHRFKIQWVNADMGKKEKKCAGHIPR